MTQDQLYWRALKHLFAYAKKHKLRVKEEHYQKLKKKVEEGCITLQKIDDHTQGKLR